MDLKKIINKKEWAADYMVNEITHIIKKFDKRDPGSKGKKTLVNIWQKCSEKIAVAMM